MNTHKQYISPEFELLEVEIYDVILASVENYGSYVDPDPGDWGDDPIFDGDDEIEW